MAKFATSNINCTCGVYMVTEWVALNWEQEVSKEFVS